jgi:hypothetical protein
MSIVDHPEEWPPDSRECVFLAHALFRFPEDDVWKALLSGELEARSYCKGRTDFGPIQLSRMEFSNQAGHRDQILSECAINIVETDLRRPAAIRRRIPVSHWLYVTRVSFDRFIKARPGTVAQERSAATLLADYFRRNSDLSRGQAKLALIGAGYNLGPRPFDHVWVEGRRLAKLPIKGKSGRKSQRKSPRKSRRKSPR